jgi:hypothetical protein
VVDRDASVGREAGKVDPLREIAEDQGKEKTAAPHKGVILEVLPLNASVEAVAAEGATGQMEIERNRRQRSKELLWKQGEKTWLKA